MQMRFYDSAEPGPPHGWLDADQEVPSSERPVWENAVTVVQQTARRLADSLLGDGASSQIWGDLRGGGCWWIYHVIQAGEDRFGRPGRTLTVLFCSDNKEGFDWKIIGTVAPEMEALAKNRSHLASLLRRLDNSQPSALLTDNMLKQSFTPLLEALKSEMNRLMDGLGEGCHEYFTITENGTVTNRGQENFSTKPPPPPLAAKPISKTAPPSAPIKKSQPNRPPLMKKFISHTLVLLLGFGFGAYCVYSLKPPAENPSKNQPVLRSNDEAISHLREATNYLEKSLALRKKPSSSDKSPSAPLKQPN
jgi:hypothetical protein